MVVYSKNKNEFLSDVNSGNIADIITDCLKKKIAYYPNSSEFNSYKRSLPKIASILNDPYIPSNLRVSIEYTFPLTAKRADLIITGRNKDEKYVIIIIELKQWSKIELTDSDGIVKLKHKNTLEDKTHPAYQAWTYLTLLRDLNEEAQKENIIIIPCVYLHDYIPDGIINSDFYGKWLNKVYMFYKHDKENLCTFLKENICYADDINILQKIEDGEKKPSKELKKAFSTVLDTLVLLDEQKISFENAKVAASISNPTNKITCILEGRAGTGKTILAVILMAALTNKCNKITYYTARNETLRDYLKYHLEQNELLKKFSAFIVSPSRFVTAKENEYPAIVVDEAHRMTKKSPVFNKTTNKWEKVGENQINEIIKASPFNIFFLDEDQIISLEDIGTKQEIEKQAGLLGSSVINLPALPSQFRCNGSDGYIQWLDNVLQIRKTANKTLEGIVFNVTITSSANALKEDILEKNRINNKSRMLGSYIDDWISRGDPNKYDMNYDNGECKLRYNKQKDGNTWIRKPEAVYDMGILHKCQGLDLDYAGVFIGQDLIVRNGTVETHPEKRSHEDSTIKGYSNYNKEHVDRIIKNTYKVLLTRAHKGCYIYSEDEETREYLKSLILKK